MNKIDYLRMIAKCLENILTAIHQILKKKRRKNMKYLQLVMTLITAIVIELLEQKLA